MNKLFFLIALLISKIAIGQNIKITFLEENSNSPIVNVRIYDNEKLLATTNEYGIAEINSANKLNIIKEEYEDISISPINNKTYFLKKIKLIFIEEIVVKEKTASEILDLIQKSTTAKNNLYNFPEVTHFYNLFKTKKDTLHYFNNRLFKGENAILTDNQNKIIRKFSYQNNNYLYNINKKPILFFSHFTIGNAPYNCLDIQYLCKNQGKFNLKLSASDEGKYIITFTPKKNNTEYPFNGRIIVDMTDLGIYEFHYNTISNKKTIRTSAVLVDKFFSYQILNENCLIQYNKNEEGRYDLITFNYKVNFISKDKALKNEVFEVTSIKEPTTNISIYNKLKKINLINFEIN